MALGGGSLISPGLKSSGRHDWETPQALYDELDAEFHFQLDSCANADNAKHVNYYSPADEALWQRWKGTVWMNPPYGREIGSWIRKAHNEAQGGATVVCLLPARTDTSWWHDYCMKGEIRFIRGRIKFSGASHNAPFPSAIVIFRPPGVPT